MTHVPRGLAHNPTAIKAHLIADNSYHNHALQTAAPHVALPTLHSHLVLRPSILGARFQLAAEMHAEQQVHPCVPEGLPIQWRSRLEWDSDDEECGELE